MLRRTRRWKAYVSKVANFGSYLICLSLYVHNCMYDLVGPLGRRQLRARACGIFGSGRSFGGRLLRLSLHASEMFWTEWWCFLTSTVRSSHPPFLRREKCDSSLFDKKMSSLPPCPFPTPLECACFGAFGSSCFVPNDQ